MGPLGEIFNPGMRHEIEERRSKELRREEEGQGEKGDLRIDLESGFVVIHSPATETTDAAASTEDAGKKPAKDATES